MYKRQGLKIPRSYATDKEELEMAAEGNEYTQKAYERLVELSADEELSLIHIFYADNHVGKNQRTLEAVHNDKDFVVILNACLYLSLIHI